MSRESGVPDHPLAFSTTGVSRRFAITVMTTVYSSDIFHKRGFVITVRVEQPAHAPNLPRRLAGGPISISNARRGRRQTKRCILENDGNRANPSTRCRVGNK